MKVELSGTRNGQPWPKRGEVGHVPDAEGADLCASGMADPVADPPAARRVEKATPPPEEKRSPRPARTRAKRTDAD